MNPIRLYFVALLSGGLFAIGLSLSGMIVPANVIGFLNVAALIDGEWNPSLAYVMAGALMVFIPGYFLFVKPRTKPVLTEQFSLPNIQTVDTRLLIGASLFGLGWGLVGLCPGPVVASLALGDTKMWLFFIAMVTGSKLAKRWLV